MVFDSTTRLADSSIRYERYLDGFRRLGHHATLLTTVASADGVDWAETVPDRAALLDPELWRTRRPEVVVVPTWLGLVDLLRVVRPHATQVVALADSDGCVGARAHPLAVLERLLTQQATVVGRVRAAGWWARQYLGVNRSVDKGMLASIRLCDKVLLTTDAACANLRAFLHAVHAPELGTRLGTAPYPIDDSFEQTPVCTTKLPQVVVVGRWADPQKGGRLLAKALTAFVRRVAGWRVVVVGSNGEQFLRPLLTAHPDRVEYRGVVPQSEVLALLDRSRILFSPSLWESGPIIAGEALLRGCSVVGRHSVPSFREYAAASCGSVYRSPHKTVAADALRAEAIAWERGDRTPETLAGRWRGVFAPAVVAHRCLQNDCPTAAPSSPPAPLAVCP